MFLHVSVILSTEHPPLADTPPPYASYWNAFLYIDFFCKNLIAHEFWYVEQ